MRIANAAKLNVSELDGTARRLYGFCSWFDVAFHGDAHDVILSTAPDQPTTHWRQTVLLFQQPVEIPVDDTAEGALNLDGKLVSTSFVSKLGTMLAKLSCHGLGLNADDETQLETEL